MSRYAPGTYWDNVGRELLKHSDNISSIASDDTPFYELKQTAFFEEFLDPALDGAVSVLEVGQGPGGNLARLQSQGKEVFGVDVSSSMIELARKRGIQHLFHMDGCELPLGDSFCDAVFTSTVLQHNRAEDAHKLLGEMARVARREIHLFEDTSAVPVRDRRSHWLRQPVWYASRLQCLGYELVVQSRLPLAYQEIGATIARIAVDRKLVQGAAPTERRLRVEQRMLRLGRALDRSIPPWMGLTRMSFRRVGI